MPANLPIMPVVFSVNSLRPSLTVRPPGVVNVWVASMPLAQFIMVTFRVQGSRASMVMLLSSGICGSGSFRGILLTM